jgi:hypothetical protein
MHNPLQQPPQDGFFTASQLPASEPVSAQLRSNRFACKPKAYPRNDSDTCAAPKKPTFFQNEDEISATEGQQAVFVVVFFCWYRAGTEG